MPAYGGPPLPAPRPEPDRTACGNCGGKGVVKHHLWQNGRITDQHNTERCPSCGGTGTVGRSRKRSGWDVWLEERTQTHG